MDELAKTEARNYLSAAGFFLIAAGFLLTLLTKIGSSTFIEVNDSIHLVIGIGLLVVATLLIVLHKRDMISILFFLIGFLELFFAFTPPGFWSIIIMGFAVIVALVTLASKDRQKWLLFLIPLIWFVLLLIVWIGKIIPLTNVIYGVLTVLSLYYAFCCACERCNLPGAKTLTADATTDFKASGSVLGYMLFAIIAGSYAIHYLVGDQVLSMASLWTIECLTACLLVYIAILLLVVGRMRFTPVMFLLMGLASLLSLFCSGSMFVGITILYVVIGLFAMLRKESRILPGLMLIVYGPVFFFTDSAGSAAIVSPVASAILNGIPALIAVYLSFVIYSQRKLPKF